MPHVFNPPSAIPDIVNPLLSCLMLLIPPLSFPTLLIGNPWFSPAGPHKQRNKKTLDSR